MITFDGFYSFISLLLSLLAIEATKYINKKDAENFPFGKAVLEPLLVIFKSLVLLFMCTSSLISSIKQILSGGNEVETSSALVYSLISSIGCIIVYLYMRKSSKNLNSEIVKSESNQWFMDALVSLGVLIGFIISLILINIGLGNLSKYIDPGMVILSSIIFLPIPINSIVESFKELISFNADESIYEEINSLVKEIEKDYSIRDSIARVAKIGRELKIEIDFILSKNSKIKSVDDMDKVREIIDNNTNHFKMEKRMNISFTNKRKWSV
ncbi:cation diffusion facilitator family transporter [Caproiciproducens sp. MSJ-32]|uniref:cation diffusion facilitator family transporter n=1 Tax=Caproiciproducens sp. MSJ-32 TaxID=2841527 RepID=UPI001C10B5DA|nr:cation transporter [Caproiciproducens sp. MSJ-32]MBU5454048.1 cation transporter [Caproiciproducens sp. MSJ-32]